MTTVKPG